MGDKPSSSLSSVVAPATTFWRRSSRRLTPADRDLLLRRHLENAVAQAEAKAKAEAEAKAKAEAEAKAKAQVQASTAGDPEGPTPPKRECPQLDQKEDDKEKQRKDKEKEKEKEQKEKEKEIEKEKEKETPYECPLCFESVRDRKPVSTKCGHIFCQECLEASLRKVRKCPMCNAIVKRNPFIRVFM